MIEIKEEKNKIQMNKLIHIIFFIAFTFTIYSYAQAESKIANKVFGSKDCSKYSTNTFSGLSDYVKCKKGLEPSNEENVFKSLKGKKSKSKEFDPNKPCDEFTTKTLAGLFGKYRCIRQ